MNALISEGKIKTYGGSNWTHQRLAEAIEYAKLHSLVPPVVSSPHYSMALQVNNPWIGTSVTLTGREQKKARTWYENTGMPVLAFSPLCRGLLSGKFKSSEPQLAKKYLDEFAVKGYLSEENLRILARCEETAAGLGISVSQIALAWLMHSKMNTFAIVSFSSENRVKEGAAAADIILDTETYSRLCFWD